MGNDVIDVEITLPDGKKKFVQMKRIEALLLDMYNSDSSPKQDNILSYGFGKVPDKLEVTDKKTIRVTIEKKESANDSIS